MSLYAETQVEAEAAAHPLPPYTSYAWCVTCGKALVSCGNEWHHHDGSNGHAPHPPEVVL